MEEMWEKAAFVPAHELLDALGKRQRMDAAVAAWMTTRPEGVSQAALAKALKALGHNTVSPMASYGGRQVVKYYNAVRAALSHGDHFAAA
eukprot:2145244-Lingulodinium_polyedra.AAC.1